MAIALSHGGPTIYRGSARSNEVLIGTVKGVISIEREPKDDGKWHVAHRSLAGTHIHAIAIEPETGTIFAGAHHGSIFASSDNGRTWEPRDNGLTEKDVYCLEIGRGPNGSRIYAGTEPAHIFYTDDLGQNWIELPALREVDKSKWLFPDPPHVAHTKHIATDPQNPNVLYVCVEQGGLFRTLDGGKSFHQITGMDDDLHRTLIDPLDTDHVYISTGFGLYVTRDAGKTIEQLTDVEHEIGGYPDLLVFDPNRPERLIVTAARNTPDYWVRERNSFSRISKSHDGGKSWMPVAGFPERMRTAFEAMCVEESKGRLSIFAATATGEVWCSGDSGERWTEVLRGLAPVSKGIHHEAFVES